MPTPIQVLSDLNPQDQVLDQIYFADDDNRIKSDQSWDFDPQDTDFHDNSDNGSERVKNCRSSVGRGRGRGWRERRAPEEDKQCRQRQ